jgi:hypothetical protein
MHAVEQTGGAVVDRRLAPAGLTRLLGSYGPVACLSGNPAATGPVAMPQVLSTIASAFAGTGQGGWDFAADSGVAKRLAVVIPGDASAGAYQSTLTFTTAPPAS